jgi:tRNA threonylcarbamoyladenosine biosynthesis protein TsaB
LEIPLISISTLLILAKKIDLKSGLIIPVLDARRDEVYCSVIDSNFNIIEPDSPKIIINSSFEDYLKNNKLHFIGSGQKKCKELINPNNNLNFYNEDALPSSKEMAELSYTKFINSDFEDLAYFEPAYLKNFILDSLNR